MNYIPGKAMPGEELRAHTLDYREITELIGTVCAGTLNVLLDQDLPPRPPDHTTEHYKLWECKLSTAAMIEADEPGFPGWIIQVQGEHFPANFIEVLSPIHLRTALKKTNFPSFPIEVAY